MTTTLPIRKCAGSRAIRLAQVGFPHPLLMARRGRAVGGQSGGAVAATARMSGGLVAAHSGHQAKDMNLSLVVWPGGWHLGACAWLFGPLSSCSPHGSASAAVDRVSSPCSAGISEIVVAFELRGRRHA